MATIKRDPDVLDDKDYASGVETPAEEKIVLVLDGKAVELDLTKEHANELRGDVESWFAIGTEIKPTTSTATRRPGPARASSGDGTTARAKREQTQRIREWCLGQQIKINDKGRIPDEARGSYFDAHPDEARIA